MSISTISNQTFRAASLGVLALTILAASANNSFAQNVTNLPTIAAGITPYFIPEPVLTVPGPELMTVNIAGAQFLPAGFSGEVDMFEIVAGVQILSDRILFDNTGPGNSAMITFLSDDEQGNFPRLASGAPYPTYPPLPVIGLGEGPLTTSIPMLDAGINPYMLTATMVSDGELGTVNPFLPQGVSDLLALSAVPTPEPSTVCLAGMGLAALAGLAYRRRRTMATA